MCISLSVQVFLLSSRAFEEILSLFMMITIAPDDVDHEKTYNHIFYKPNRSLTFYETILIYRGLFIVVHDLILDGGGDDETVLCF